MRVRKPKPKPKAAAIPDILPAIAKAQAAFCKDLPRLLKQHFGQWAAYTPKGCLGIGSTKTELYQQCLKQGLKPGEFMVLSIEPEIDNVIDYLPDV